MDRLAAKDDDLLPNQVRAPALRSNCLSMRGSRAWREWVFQLASHNRVRISDLIDRTLIDYAEKSGFDPPPPLR
jgi:hypothetical protein